MNKDRLERVLETRIDPGTGEPWQRVKFHPALISYTVGKARTTKRSLTLTTWRSCQDRNTTTAYRCAHRTRSDRRHVPRIADRPEGTHSCPSFLPASSCTGPRPSVGTGQRTSRPRTRHALLFFVEQAIWTSSVLNRFQPKGFKQVNKYLPGVYYVPSHSCELSPWYAIEARGKRSQRSFRTFDPILIMR